MGDPPSRKIHVRSFVSSSETALRALHGGATLSRFLRAGLAGSLARWLQWLADQRWDPSWRQVELKNTLVATTTETEKLQRKCPTSALFHTSAHNLGRKIIISPTSSHVMTSDCCTYRKKS